MPACLPLVRGKPWKPQQLPCLHESLQPWFGAAPIEAGRAGGPCGVTLLSSWPACSEAALHPALSIEVLLRTEPEPVKFC